MSIPECFQPRYNSLTDWGIQCCQKITCLSDKNKNCLLGRITKLFLAVPFITLCVIAQLIYWVGKTVALFACCFCFDYPQEHLLDFFTLVILPIIGLAQAILFNRLPQANRNISAALEKAVRRDDYERVQRLVKYEIDPYYHWNYVKPFEVAARRVDPKMMQLICSGDPKNVKECLEHSSALSACIYSSIIQRSVSCITESLMQKCLKTVEIILKAMEGSKFLENEENRNMFTALLNDFAKYYPVLSLSQLTFYQKIIGMLLDHGDDPSPLMGEGISPFLTVIEKTKFKMVIPEEVVKRMLSKNDKIFIEKVKDDKFHSYVNWSFVIHHYPQQLSGFVANSLKIADKQIVSEQLEIAMRIALLAGDTNSMGVLLQSGGVIDYQSVNQFIELSEAWISQVKLNGICSQTKLLTMLEFKQFKDLMHTESLISYIETLSYANKIGSKEFYYFTVEDFETHIVKMKAGWEPWNELFKNKLIPKVIEFTSHLGQTPNVIADLWMGYTGSDHADLHKVMKPA